MSSLKTFKYFFNSLRPILLPGLSPINLGFKRLSRVSCFHFSLRSVVSYKEVRTVSINDS